MRAEYSNDHTGYASDTLMTFALGLAAGAALGLIFAPMTGRETRARLAEQGRRAAEKGRDFVNETSGVASEAIERTRETASAMADKVSRVVEEGKVGYADAVNRSKGAVGAVANAVREQAAHG